MKIEQVTDQVIKFQLGSTVAVGEMQELAGILAEKCWRQQPFGLIMVRDGERQNNPEATKVFNAWVNENKSLLNTYCAGVAMVMTSEEERKRYKAAARTMVLKMFGCAGDMFAVESEAMAWLHDQMSHVE